MIAKVENLRGLLPQERPAHGVLSRAPAASVSIDILDDIGPGGVTPADINDQLGAIDPKAKISLRINSYGGDAFAGLAIYEALARHEGRTIAIIDGVAASAASIVAMAATKIIMGRGAFLMIHEAHASIAGEAHELKRAASVLESLSARMAAIYAGRCGRPVDEIASMMAAETWLDAEAALALGLADEIGPDRSRHPARTYAQVYRFKNLPAALRKPAAALSPAPSSRPASLAAERARIALLRARFDARKGSD